MSKVFCVGQYNTSCLGFIFKAAINCFGKIRVVLKRTADVLAVRLRWFEERRLVLVCRLVKMAAVC